MIDEQSSASGHDYVSDRSANISHQSPGAHILAIGSEFAIMETGCHTEIFACLNFLGVSQS